MYTVTPKVLAGHRTARLKTAKLSRNAEIVALVDRGTMTLVEVGLVFGVSRERIRQIYKRETGKPVRARINKKAKIRMAQREIFLNEVIGKCRACKKEMTRQENANKNGVHCKDCVYISQVEGRLPEITLFCEICGNKYHPNNAFKNILEKSHTCSTRCGIFLREKNYALGNKNYKPRNGGRASRAE